LEKEIEKLGDSVERATYRGKANEKEIKKLLRLEKDFALLKRIISMEGSREDINKLEARGSTPSHPTGQGLEAEAKTKQKAKTEEAFTSSLELRASSKVLSSSLEPRASSQNIFINNFLSNLQRIAKDQNVEYELSDFGSIFEIAQKFYAQVLKRDGIMFEKIQEVLNRDQFLSGALVVGGFHVEGLKELLKKEKIGYCVIAPQLMHPGDRGVYFRNIRESAEHLESQGQTLPSPTLNMQMKIDWGTLAEFLMHLGREALEKESSIKLNPQFFVSWKNQCTEKFHSVIDRLGSQFKVEVQALDVSGLDEAGLTKDQVIHLLNEGGSTAKLTLWFLKLSLKDEEYQTLMKELGVGTALLPSSQTQGIQSYSQKSETQGSPLMSLSAFKLPLMSVANVSGAVSFATNLAVLRRKYFQGNLSIQIPQLNGEVLLMAGIQIEGSTLKSSFMIPREIVEIFTFHGISNIVVTQGSQLDFISVINHLSRLKDRGTPLVSRKKFNIPGGVCVKTGNRLTLTLSASPNSDAVPIYPSGNEGITERIEDVEGWIRDGKLIQAKSILDSIEAKEGKRLKPRPGSLTRQYNGARAKLRAAFEKEMRSMPKLISQKQYRRASDTLVGLYEGFRDEKSFQSVLALLGDHATHRLSFLIWVSQIRVKGKNKTLKSLLAEKDFENLNDVIQEAKRFRLKKQTQRYLGKTLEGIYYQCLGKDEFFERVLGYKKEGILKLGLVDLNKIDLQAIPRLEEAVIKVQSRSQDRVLARAVSSLGFADLNAFSHHFGGSDYDALMKHLIEEAIAAKGNSPPVIAQYLGVSDGFVRDAITSYQIDASKLERSGIERLRVAVNQQTASKSYDFKRLMQTMGYLDRVAFKRGCQDTQGFNEIMKDYFEHALEDSGLNLKACARRLGVPWGFLYTWMNELEIEKSALPTREGKRLEEVLQQMKREEIRARGPLGKRSASEVDQLTSFNLLSALLDMGWRDFEKFSEKYGEDTEVRRVLRNLFEEVLELVNGQVKRAAPLVGLTRTKFSEWARKLGVSLKRGEMSPSLQVASRDRGIGQKLEQAFRDLPSRKQDRIDFAMAKLGFGGTFDEERFRSEGKITTSVRSFMRRYGNSSIVSEVLTRKIEQVLIDQGGVVKHAAERLGLSEPSLASFIKRLKVDVDSLPYDEAGRFRRKCTELYGDGIPNLRAVAESLGYESVYALMRHKYHQNNPEFLAAVDEVIGRALREAQGGWVSAEKLLGGVSNSLIDGSLKRTRRSMMILGVAGRWPWLQEFYDWVGHGWVGQAFMPAFIEKVLFVVFLANGVAYLSGLLFGLSPPIVAIALGLMVLWHFLHIPFLRLIELLKERKYLWAKSLILSSIGEVRSSITQYTLYTLFFLTPLFLLFAVLSIILPMPLSYEGIITLNLAISLFIPHFVVDLRQFLKLKKELDPRLKLKERVSELLKTERPEIQSQIFVHQDGMGLVPTVQALKELGVLEFLQRYDVNKSVTVQEIINHINSSVLSLRGEAGAISSSIDETALSPSAPRSGPKKGLTPEKSGDLQVTLEILEMMGWLNRDGEPASHQMTVTLTEEGRVALQMIAENDQRLTDFLPVAANMDEYLFGRAPPQDDLKNNLAQLVEFAKNNWNLPSETDPARQKIRFQMIGHFNGMLAGPMMVALGRRGFFEPICERDRQLAEIPFDFFQEGSWGVHSEDLKKLGEAHHLQSTFDFFAQLGWMEKKDDRWSMTDRGICAASLTRSYGVTTSYLATFVKLKDLITGKPFSELFPRNPDGSESHVNRAMNVWGSGGAHETYFKKIDVMVREIFSHPIEEWPKGIADMGCGDGTFLIHLYHLVEKIKAKKIEDFDRKLKGCKTHPCDEYQALKKKYEDYHLILIGADYNEASRKSTLKNLKAARIPEKFYHVVFGNIIRPNDLARDVQEKYSLARISHHISTASADSASSASSDSVGHTQHTAKYASYGLGRLPRIQSGLDALVTKSDEKCGLDLSQFLHVRSFLDHNRPYERPDSVDPSIESVEKGAYVDQDGRPLPPLELQQNLINHLKSWAPFIGRFGLISPELHGVDPRRVRDFLGKTLAISYKASHGYSRQYTVCVEEFKAAAQAAGLQWEYTPIPRPDKGLTTITVGRLTFASGSAKISDAQPPSSQAGKQFGGMIGTLVSTTSFGTFSIEFLTDFIAHLFQLSVRDRRLRSTSSNPLQEDVEAFFVSRWLNFFIDPEFFTGRQRIYQTFYRFKNRFHRVLAPLPEVYHATGQTSTLSSIPDLSINAVGVGKEHGVANDQVEKAFEKRIRRRTKILFKGLEDELYRLLIPSKLFQKMRLKTITRPNQQKFAELATPVIQSWIQNHRSEITELLPLIQTVHDSKKEVHGWYSIKFSSQIWIFIHSFNPLENTFIHDHGDALGFVCSLTPGLFERRFLNHDQSVNTTSLIQKEEKFVVPGEVDSLLPSTDTIHQIQNTVNKTCFMLEIYIWGEIPLSHMKVFIPVENEEGKYSVMKLPLDLVKQSLFVTLREEAEEIPVTEENLARGLARGPIITTADTAIVSINQVRALRSNILRCWEKRDGFLKGTLLVELKSEVNLKSFSQNRDEKTKKILSPDYVTDKKEQIFIGEDFEEVVGHAGLSRNSVYAKDWSTVAHELVELRLWRRFGEIVLGLSDQELNHGDLRTWIIKTLDRNGLWEMRVRAMDVYFHRLGCEARSEDGSTGWAVDLVKRMADEDPQKILEAISVEVDQKIESINFGNQKIEEDQPTEWLEEISRGYMALETFEQGNTVETQTSYSLMKLGDPDEVEYWAQRMIERIRRELGDRLHPGEEWVIASPQGFDIPSPIRLVAEKVAQEFGITLVPLRTDRAPETAQYAGLDLPSRTNVFNGFSVDDTEALKGKRVIFLDDCYTTGTTLQKAYQFFSQMGVREVRPCQLVNLKGEPNFEDELNRRALEEDKMGTLSRILNNEEATLTTKLFQYAFELEPVQFMQLMQKLSLKGKNKIYYATLAAKDILRPDHFWPNAWLLAKDLEQNPPEESSLTESETKKEILKSIFGGLETQLQEALQSHEFGRQLQVQDPKAKIHSQDQQAFAQVSAPIIEKWVAQHHDLLNVFLPYLIDYPQGDEDYHRNGVCMSEKFGIFAHVWAPGGETRIHNHGGALGLTCPLGAGMKETVYQLKEASSLNKFGKGWDGQVLRLQKLEEHELDSGKVGIVTRGPGSIHTIRNASDQPRIMLELYFWRTPFHNVNIFIPVEKSQASPEGVRPYYALNVDAARITRPLQSLGQGAQEINLTLEDLPPLFRERGFFLTTNGTMIIDEEHAMELFRMRAIQKVWRCVNPQDRDIILIELKPDIKLETSLNQVYYRMPIDQATVQLAQIIPEFVRKDGANKTHAYPSKNSYLEVIAIYRFRGDTLEMVLATPFEADLTGQYSFRNSHALLAKNPSFLSQGEEPHGNIVLSFENNDDPISQPSNVLILPPHHHALESQRRDLILASRLIVSLLKELGVEDQLVGNLRLVSLDSSLFSSEDLRKLLPGDEGSIPSFAVHDPHLVKVAELADVHHYSAIQMRRRKHRDHHEPPWNSIVNRPSSEDDKALRKLIAERKEIIIQRFQEGLRRYAVKDKFTNSRGYREFLLAQRKFFESSYHAIPSKTRQREGWSKSRLSEKIKAIDAELDRIDHSRDPLSQSLRNMSLGDFIDFMTDIIRNFDLTHAHAFRNNPNHIGHWKKIGEKGHLFFNLDFLNRHQDETSIVDEALCHEFFHFMGPHHQLIRLLMPVIFHAHYPRIPNLETRAKKVFWDMGSDDWNPLGHRIKDFANGRERRPSVPPGGPGVKAPLKIEFEESKLEDILPDTQSWKIELLKKYKGHVFAEKLTQALDDLTKSKIVLFPVVIPEGRHNPKDCIFGFNALAPPSTLKDIPANSIAISKEVIHYFNRLQLEAFLMGLALAPHATPEEIQGIIQEIYPELHHIQVDPKALIIKHHGICRPYHERFIRQYGSTLIDSLVEIFGVQEKASQGDDGRVSELKAKWRKDLSHEERTRWLPVINAFLSVMIDPRYEGKIDRRQIVKYLKEIPLSNRCKTYILKFLRAQHHVHSQYPRARKQIIADFFHVIREQSFTNPGFFVDFRSEVAWWTLFSDDFLCDAYADSETKPIRIRTLANNVLNYFVDHLPNVLNSIHFESEALEGKIRFLEIDIDRAFQEYEFQDRILQLEGGVIDRAKKTYREIFERAISDIKKSILETDILAETLFILYGMKTLDFSEIENIDIFFIGEGAWKMSFRADVKLRGGRILPVVFKAIKPFQLFLPRLVGFRYLKREMLRHQYYSSSTRRRGVSTFGVFHPKIHDEYPERINRVTTEEYIGYSRLDAYMERRTGEDVLEWKRRWRSTGVSILTQLVRMMVEEGIYLEDPKPANIMIAERDENGVSVQDVYFVDLGEMDIIPHHRPGVLKGPGNLLVASSGPKNPTEMIRDQILGMLVGPYQEPKFKGVEILYPELRMVDPRKEWKTYRTVGFQEVGIAIHRVFKGHLPSVRRFLDPSDMRAIGKALLLDITRKARFIETPEDLKLLEDIIHFSSVGRKTLEYQRARSALLHRYNELTSPSTRTLHDQSPVSEKVVDAFLSYVKNHGAAPESGLYHLLALSLNKIDFSRFNSEGWTASYDPGDLYITFTSPDGKSAQAYVLRGYDGVSHITQTLSQRLSEMPQDRQTAIARQIHAHEIFEKLWNEEMREGSLNDVSQAKIDVILNRFFNEMEKLGFSSSGPHQSSYRSLFKVDAMKSFIEKKLAQLSHEAVADILAELVEKVETAFLEGSSVASLLDLDDQILLSSLDEFILFDEIFSSYTRPQTFNPPTATMLYQSLVQKGLSVNREAFTHFLALKVDQGDFVVVHGQGHNKRFLPASRVQALIHQGILIPGLFLRKGKAPQTEYILSEYSEHYSGQAALFGLGLLLTPENLIELKEVFEFAFDYYSQHGKVGDLSRAIRRVYRVSQMEKNPELIAAALLLEIPESKLKTNGPSPLGDWFEKIKKIVGPVNRMRTIPYQGHLKSDRESHIGPYYVQDFKDMVVSMIDRPEAFELLMAHQLAVLEGLTGEKLEPEEKKRKFEEMVYIWASLAGDLNMKLAQVGKRGKVSQEPLEMIFKDLAFRHIQPDQHESILQEVEKVMGVPYDDRLRRYAEVTLPKELLKKIKAEYTGEKANIVSAKGGLKGPYAIQRKVQYRHKGVDEMYDVIRLMIVVKDIPTAYAISSLPVFSQRRAYDDQIARHRRSGLESLHIDIPVNIPGSSKSIYAEVQILTPDMVAYADYGPANHRLYELTMTRNLVDFQETVDQVSDDLRQNYKTLRKKVEKKNRAYIVLKFENNIETIVPLRMIHPEDDSRKPIVIDLLASPLVSKNYEDFVRVIKTKVVHRVDRRYANLREQVKNGDRFELIRRGKDIQITEILGGDLNRRCTTLRAMILLSRAIYGEDYVKRGHERGVSIFLQKNAHGLVFAKMSGAQETSTIRELRYALIHRVIRALQLSKEEYEEEIYYLLGFRIITPEEFETLVQSLIRPEWRKIVPEWRENGLISQINTPLKGEELESTDKPARSSKYKKGKRRRPSTRTLRDQSPVSETVVDAFLSYARSRGVTPENGPHHLSALSMSQIDFSEFKSDGWIASYTEGDPYITFTGLDGKSAQAYVLRGRDGTPYVTQTFSQRLAKLPQDRQTAIARQIHAHEIFERLWNEKIGSQDLTILTQSQINVVLDKFFIALENVDFSIEESQREIYRSLLVPSAIQSYCADRLVHFFGNQVADIMAEMIEKIDTLISQNNSSLLKEKTLIQIDEEIKESTLDHFMSAMDQNVLSREPVSCLGFSNLSEFNDYVDHHSVEDVLIRLGHAMDGYFASGSGVKSGEEERFLADVAQIVLDRIKSRAPDYTQENISAALLGEKVLAEYSRLASVEEGENLLGAISNLEKQSKAVSSSEELEFNFQAQRVEDSLTPFPPVIDEELGPQKTAVASALIPDRGEVRNVFRRLALRRKVVESDPFLPLLEAKAKSLDRKFPQYILVDLDLMVDQDAIELSEVLARLKHSVQMVFFNSTRNAASLDQIKKRFSLREDQVIDLGSIQEGVSEAVIAGVLRLHPEVQPQEQIRFLAHKNKKELCEPYLEAEKIRRVYTDHLTTLAQSIWVLMLDHPELLTVEQIMELGLSKEEALEIHGLIDERKELKLLKRQTSLLKAYDELGKNSKVRLTMM
ncbi:MAG: hypothetical protein HYS07_09140, partial [Chlamydiae bacterium]|nr:hypothetical protein [Chlamydiota bacterium]